MRGSTGVAFMRGSTGVAFMRGSTGVAFMRGSTTGAEQECGELMTFCTILTIAVVISMLATQDHSMAVARSRHSMS